MTQGPQQPEYQGPPPAMYPPVPGPPRRSNKTALIIVTVVAVVIALVAVAVLSFGLTRSDEGPTSTVASATSSSPAPGTTSDFRLRGTLTSKASVCVASGLTSQELPKFETPLDYSRPTLDADITKARQVLSRLASRISPNAVEPVRSTLQDWITAFADILDSYQRREPAADVKFKGDLVDNLAGQINGICKV